MDKIEKIFLVIFSLIFIFIIFRSEKLKIMSPSSPPESGIILLTFDGYKSSIPMLGLKNFKPSGLSDSIKIEIKNRVSEIFKYWDVVVTTSDSLFYTFPVNKRIRCIIANNDISYYDGYYFRSIIGKSKLNSLNLSDTTPTIISSVNSDFNAEIISKSIAHEIGHALGLYHQSKWRNKRRISEYDNGDSILAPLMGWSFLSKNAVWRDGKNMFGEWQSDTTIISWTWPRLKEIKF